VAQDLVFTNARIIDPASRSVVNGALWIQGGRIVGKSAQAPADAPDKRIDLGGKFVMPALVDMHVHSFGDNPLGQRLDRGGTQETAERVLRAGVTVFLDLGNPGVIHGYFVHRELVRLQEAGLSTWDALAASTTTAGKFLNRKFGVQPGDEANLLVLAASPLENIANTQAIELVIQRGRVVYDR
jgi:imidazolonepropionase-like amidohydrolase